MAEQIEMPDYWKDDKLDRYEQAILLKSFLDQQYASGFLSEDRTKSFVLNLDAEWGYGKTFFLNRFSRDLIQEHIVLRYNAWANDYAKDPLLSFISQITRELCIQLDENGPSAEDNISRKSSLIASALKVIKSAGKAAAPKLFTAGVSTLILGYPVLTGSQEDSDDSDETNKPPALSKEDQEHLKKTIGASVEAAMASVDSDIFDGENSRREAVESFRKSLADIIRVLTEQNKPGVISNSKKAPIYILIDELDRCRPDFTIELIECVKHLFSVDGLYFIFATDGEQLQAALNGIYGEHYDAEIYFNRIFNREIGLHVPDQRKISETLITEYGLTNAVQDYKLIPYAIDTLKEDKLSLAEDFRIVAEFFGLDLRSQKQLLASFHTLLLARSSKGLKTHSIPSLCLTVLWQRKKSLFRKLKNSPHSIKSDQAIEPLLRPVISGGKYDISFSTYTKDGSVINAKIPTILISFLRMFSINPPDYLKEVKSASTVYNGSESLYTAALKQEVQTAGVNDFSRNPLSSYFEQITMVS
ncbi:KAP family P-loop NTPase fold protein [Marinobacter salicampi]|uniref:KAP family P-loop NTPase fold protein n=1 Tax=Marinobacter salicampi TaxID=435907 RepID=UPI00140DC1A2|nr:P-loop NTPase fold protein [Marinobacter salicampi]